MLYLRSYKCKSHSSTNHTVPLVYLLSCTLLVVMQSKTCRTIVQFVHTQKVMSHILQLCWNRQCYREQKLNKNFQCRQWWWWLSERKNEMKLFFSTLCWSDRRLVCQQLPHQRVFLCHQKILLLWSRVVLVLLLLLFVRSFSPALLYCRWCYCSCCWCCGKLMTLSATGVCVCVCAGTVLGNGVVVVVHCRR